MNLVSRRGTNSKRASREIDLVPLSLPVWRILCSLLVGRCDRRRIGHRTDASALRSRPAGLTKFQTFTLVFKRKSFGKARNQGWCTGSRAEPFEFPRPPHAFPSLPV